MKGKKTLMFETLCCGIIFFFVTLFFDRKNVNWIELIFSTIIFIIVYYALSYYFDKRKINKEKNEKTKVHKMQ